MYFAFWPTKFQHIPNLQQPQALETPTHFLPRGASQPDPDPDPRKALLRRPRDVSLGFRNRRIDPQATNDLTKPPLELLFFNLDEAEGKKSLTAPC